MVLPLCRHNFSYSIAQLPTGRQRLGAFCAGRIQRNRAGVSWHTTLLAKSSVLYLCEGEDNERRLYASCSSDCKPIEIKAGRWCKPHPSASLLPSVEQRYTKPRRSGRSLFLCAFSSLAGPTFEQIGFLADFHQPMFLVVGQFAVIDLVLLTEQHHQLFNLAALDL